MGVVQHPDSIPVCHHTDYAGSRSYFYCDVIPFVRTGKAIAGGGLRTGVALAGEE